MRFLEDICDTLTRALGLAALSPWGSQAPDQKPLVPDKIHSNANDYMPVPKTVALVEQPSTSDLPKGPRFKPPNAGDNFFCDYSSMKGWQHTASSGSRTSWLEKPISADDPTGGIYDILTDYDEYWPTGAVRKVKARSLIQRGQCESC